MRLYGALDVLFAALYLYLGLVIAPSRALAFELVLCAVCALLLAAGVGLLLGRPWGRWLAIAASSVLLAFAAVVTLLLVASSAYLSSVYGSLGKGLSIVSLLCGALVLQLCGMLPILQLRSLLKR